MKLVILMVALACCLYVSHAKPQTPTLDATSPLKKLIRVKRGPILTICLHWGHCPSSRPCCAYRGPDSPNVCRERKGSLSVNGEQCVLPTVGFNTDRRDWTHDEDGNAKSSDPWCMKQGVNCG